MLCRPWFIVKHQTDCMKRVSPLHAVLYVFHFVQIKTVNVSLYGMTRLVLVMWNPAFSLKEEPNYWILLKLNSASAPAQSLLPRNAKRFVNLRSSQVNRIEGLCDWSPYVAPKHLHVSSETPRNARHKIVPFVVLVWVRATPHLDVEVFWVVTSSCSLAGGYQRFGADSASIFRFNIHIAKIYRWNIAEHGSTRPEEELSQEGSVLDLKYQLFPFLANR